jgi:hypothetical protein
MNTKNHQALVIDIAVVNFYIIIISLVCMFYVILINLLNHLVYFDKESFGIIEMMNTVIKSWNLVVLIQNYYQ